MASLWIDTDLGFDDIVALLMLERAPGIRIEGLSLVAGNSPLPTVVDNARRAAAHFGWVYPLHAGRDRPINGPQITAQHVLGPRGMRTTGGFLPDDAAPLAEPWAIAAMAAWLERTPEPTLLALGPMTNVAILALAYPDRFARLREVVWMGGSTDRGNQTAAAGYNAFADPEAAAIVFNAGVPIRMIGLNACREVTLSQDDVARLRSLGGARADLLADLVDGYTRIVHEDGSVPMAIRDPVAATALIAPEALTFEPARVDVECAGTFTRGATVVEFRVPNRATPNAQVAVGTDHRHVQDLMAEALLADGRR